MKPATIHHHARDRRNKTGCVGVKFKRVETVQGGVVVVRRFFVARMGRGKSRNFSIDSLGKNLAWVEALRCRAAWEREIAVKRQWLEPHRRARRSARRQRWAAKHGQTYRAKNRARIRALNAAAQRRYRQKKGAAK